MVDLLAPDVPLVHADEAEHRRQIAQRLNLGPQVRTELLFNGTLSSTTLNTNAATDMTWNDSVEHPDVEHTDGDAVIQLTYPTELQIYFNVEVTDGQANNRQTWALDMLHRDSSDVAIFTYTIASASYIRDDATNYDDGACAGYVNLIVAAKEDIKISSRVLGAQTPAGINNADQSKSYLRIYRKTYR